MSQTGTHEPEFEKPALLTFDFYGTLMQTKPNALRAFGRILQWNHGSDVDAEKFYDSWRKTLQDSLSGPYESYRDLGEEALRRAFSQYQLQGRAKDIDYYFDGFTKLEPWPDTEPTLQALSDAYPLGIITNIDNDLFAITPKPDVPIRYRFTAEDARGYKPDGTLFRYALKQSALKPSQIFQSGQSQRTDLIGAKPLGIRVAWINRHGLTRDSDVPVPDHEIKDLTPLVALLSPEQ